VAQFDPGPRYHQKFIEQVIDFLQTKDTSLFPFAASLNDEQMRAFIRDLRVALSDVTESGSKRGTAASGFITSDRRVRDVVAEWAAAHGEWPAGSDPRDGFTSLSAEYDPRTDDLEALVSTQDFLETE